MKTTKPSDLSLLERDAAVLDYYTREAAGKHATKPLAGLTLDQFRWSRARLVSQGALVTRNGRYIPAAPLELAA